MSTETNTAAQPVTDAQVVAWLLQVGRFYKAEKAQAWVNETKARCRPPKPIAAPSISVEQASA